MLARQDLRRAVMVPGRARHPLSFQSVHPFRRSRAASNGMTSVAEPSVTLRFLMDAAFLQQDTHCTTVLCSTVQSYLQQLINAWAKSSPLYRKTVGLQQAKRNAPSLILLPGSAPKPPPNEYTTPKLQSVCLRDRSPRRHHPSVFNREFNRLK
jgi:hypothetical protein